MGRGRVKKIPGVQTEVHHLCMYLATGVALKKRAIQARRRVADYLHFVLEKHVEELDEADRVANLKSPIMDERAEKATPPKKLPSQWRKGEKRTTYHFRLRPTTRIALQQRAVRAGRRFSGYLRLVLEKHVQELDEADRRAQRPGLGNEMGVEETSTEKLELAEREVEPTVEGKETGVFHFRLPLAMAATLDRRAFESRRRFTEYVRLALEDHLENLDKASRKDDFLTRRKEDGISGRDEPLARQSGILPQVSVENVELPREETSTEELKPLRQQVERAVLHADEVARHAHNAFAEWFDLFVAAHGEEKIRKAVQGLNLPRYQLGDERENWEDLLTRGRSLAEDLELQKSRN
jgi:predicted DNA-binding protein